MRWVTTANMLTAARNIQNTVHRSRRKDEKKPLARKPYSNEPPIEPCEGSCQAGCQTTCQSTRQIAKETRAGPIENTIEYRTKKLARAHNVHQLLLFTGDGKGSCSMACDYCFLSKKGPRRIMKPKVLRDAIEFLRNLTDKPELLFFGTEPTMQWDLIVQARGLCDWPISLTTNGYLLTPERADWMSENDVKVYVYSIDGGAEHNRHRKDAQGRETWETVAANLKYLIEAQGDWITARATWTPDNYDLVDRFKALEELGVKSIQVVPDIEVGVEWDEERVEQAYFELGKHYAWKRTPSKFVNDLVDAIATKKPKPGYPCNFGRGYWAVMPDGELRTCQRGEKIGSIYEGVTNINPLYESALCAKVVNSREPLKAECSGCIAFNYCPGVGYCSAANPNGATPTEAHCQHLRGMVRACAVWAEHRPESITLQSGVLGVIYSEAH